MKNLEINTAGHEVSNPLLTGMTAHAGIVGVEDDLFVLDPKIGQELSYEQGRLALYELAKLTGKSFMSWQPVYVDINFNQTGKHKIFHKFFDPFVCKGEIVFCTPSDKLIEYVKTRCKQ